MTANLIRSMRNGNDFFVFNHYDDDDHNKEEVRLGLQHLRHKKISFEIYLTFYNVDVV